MDSPGLSAPSSLYQDLSVKATIWLLTSLYTPDKCLKWGLDARYSTNVLQEIVSRSEDEDFFYPCPKCHLFILPAPSLLLPEVVAAQADRL